MATARHQRRSSGLAFWLVLAVVAVAAAYVALSPEHWLRAVGAMAVGLFGAAAARWALGDENSGLLRVRGRIFDVFCYLLLGVLAITFGLALHHR